MKRLYWLILLLFPLLLPGTACTLDLTIKESGRSFSVHLAETITIVLAGNPTTGYRWEMAEVEQRVLAPEPEPTFVPDSTLTGAGGRFTFRLLAIANGASRIKLVYRRPWEKNVPPSETFSVNIQVDKPEEANLSAVYVGGGGATLSAVFDPAGKKVTLTLPGGRTVVLPQAISASGARYSDGSRTFWEHQGSATYSEGEKVVFEGAVSQAPATPSLK